MQEPRPPALCLQHTPAHNTFLIGLHNLQGFSLAPYAMAVSNMMLRALLAVAGAVPGAGCAKLRRLPRLHDV